MASRRVHAKGHTSIAGEKRGVHAGPVSIALKPSSTESILACAGRPGKPFRRPGRRRMRRSAGPRPKPRLQAELGVRSRPAERPLGPEGFMTVIGTSSARTPPSGLQSAADLVSATRKAILVAAVALVVALAAIAAAAAPLLNTQLRGDDPAVPTARDLAKRLDQISAELDRLRQGLQQRE